MKACGLLLLVLCRKEPSLDGASVIINIEILAFGNLGEKIFIVFSYQKCRCEKTIIRLSRASLNVLYMSSSVK
jgi:hypothetical protein